MRWAEASKKMILGGCLLAAALGLPARPVGAAADLLLHNGTIYTLEGDEPSPVEALAIGGGEVLAAGSLESCERLADPSTRRVDLRRNWVVPGLVDAHAHLKNLAALLDQIDLRGTGTPVQVIAAVRRHALAKPGEGWLIGRGWDQNDWPIVQWPTKEMLDPLYPERPVYLRRVDGHAAWVNSAALRAAGIDATTPDPEGGEILRDPETGEPTGILIDTAEDLIVDVIPPPSAEELAARLVEAMQQSAREGLTGIHEMGVSLRLLRAFQRAEAEGNMSVRVVAYLEGDSTLQRFDASPLRPEVSARLRIEGVKLYADGALGSRGAALLEDYRDRPGHRGLLYHPVDQMAEFVQHAFARHFSVAIHAIGDRANRLALEAIERGHRQGSLADRSLPSLEELRPRIEHAQVVALEDIGRFAQLGAIPSMQPTHCTSDMPWAEERLGEERLAGAYAWRSFRNAGLYLPLGSDFPVEAVSPLRGLYAARTRQNEFGEPDAGWYPDQRLQALEALLGFTVWPARALGLADSWGRLAKGYRADLVVLDRDPLGEDPRELLEANVLMTMVEGESTHVERNFLLRPARGRR
jgi:predicted amidohydrolase YtcJ